MKKMKFVMPVMALSCAIAFAFASNNNEVAPIEYIQSGPQSCTLVTANCEGDEELCEFSSKQVYAQKNGTLCATPLMRNSL